VPVIKVPEIPELYRHPNQPAVHNRARYGHSNDGATAEARSQQSEQSEQSNSPSSGEFNKRIAVQEQVRTHHGEGCALGWRLMVSFRRFSYSRAGSSAAATFS